MAVVINDSTLGAIELKALNVDNETTTTTPTTVTEKKDETPALKPLSFAQLFKYATPGDIALFCIGIFGIIVASAVLPAINIVFGELTDSIAQPLNVKEQMTSAVINMLGLAGLGFLSFFVGFFFGPLAASRIANRWRLKYLESVLIQDMEYFDQAIPGAISLNFGDAAMDVQVGLADKFFQCLQGFFQLGFGFAVAFYFGWQLSLALLGCVPILGAVSFLLFKYGEEDGVFGKEAYTLAASVASEVSFFYFGVVFCILISFISHKTLCSFFLRCYSVGYLFMVMGSNDVSFCQ